MREERWRLAGRDGRVAGREPGRLQEKSTLARLRPALNNAASVMAKEVIEVVAAVIERDGDYLLTQRKATAVLPLLWEFPGGRVEKGESKERALIREIIGRIGLTVVVNGVMGENTHCYDTYDVHMTLYSCILPANCEPQAVGVQQVRWVPISELSSYEFPPADQESMSRLLKLRN